MTLDEKYKKLQTILKDMGKVLIAYSGGVDSSFLLKVAGDVLGDNVLGTLGLSAAYPTREFNTALNFAKDINVTVRVIKTEETDKLKFRENPPDRCFYCKSELFSKLWEIAEEEGIQYVLDGTNADDTGDFRPGMKALKEQKVFSPLKEAGLTKEEIRELSKRLGLQTWDKPAMPCLSSRFPYGQEIDIKKLKMVDAAENILRDEGFKYLRVRHYGDTARIEVSQKEMHNLLNEGRRNRIVAKLKKLGYTYITVDMEGFRSGSMNEALNIEQKKSGL